MVGVAIQGADETFETAAEQAKVVLSEAAVVADKGYHSNETMVDPAAVGVRSCIASRTGAGAGLAVLEGRAGGSGRGVWEPTPDPGQAEPAFAAESW